MIATILQFAARRVRCGHCKRWFLRVSRDCAEDYCSYQCGVNAQPDHCASSWAFTSTQGDRS